MFANLCNVQLQRGWGVGAEEEAEGRAWFECVCAQWRTPGAGGVCLPISPPHLQASGRPPSATASSLFISREAGHSPQAGPSALGARRPETSLAGPFRALRGPAGPGWCAWVPRSPSWHWPQPRCAQQARRPPARPPAPGTDQAACERRDSCSGLKYAGYFYLPTSGGEGHPTSGLGGCYTMFPFSREGKWREARLPDHMVLKSMKKN